MNHRVDFRGKGFMSPELVEKVINELDKEIAIHICGIGEPSLHPDFILVIKKLKEKFRYVSIVTNGYLFRNIGLINAVLDSGIDKISVSLDYISSEQYKKEKGGDIDKVIGFIKHFLEIRRDHSNNKPLLQINYLYMKEKYDYYEAVSSLLKIVDDPWCLYIRKLKNLAGQVDVSEEKDEELLDKIFKDKREGKVIVENWNRYLKDTNFQSDNPKICRHIYSYYMLLWNGDIVPCCIDFNATLRLGNVLTENTNLMDVFCADKYNVFRKKMEQLDYEELCICKKCSDYYKCM